jgi:hypothetical protein
VLKIKDLLKRRTEYVVYDSCDTLPLYNFVKILTTGDFDYLVKTGKAPTTVLQNIWGEISEQYSTLSQDKKSKLILDCVVDIAYLRNKLIIIQSLIDELSKGYDESIIELLQELELSVSYDGYILNTLKSVIAQAKMIGIDLKERQAEYNQMNEKSEGATTESEYYLLIADLSKFIGSVINIREISVSYFVGIYGLYKQSNERG